LFEEAILVMDSRSQSGSVRSQSVGGGWTRLYKSDFYFLDLSLQYTSVGATLVGQVLPANPERRVVGSVATKNQYSITLDREGGFKINLEQGLHDLHLHLNNGVIAVKGLEA
jgi:hypothetical protein